MRSGKAGSCTTSSHFATSAICRPDRKEPIPLHGDRRRVVCTCIIISGCSIISGHTAEGASNGASEQEAAEGSVRSPRVRSTTEPATKASGLIHARQAQPLRPKVLECLQAPSVRWPTIRVSRRRHQEALQALDTESNVYSTSVLARSVADTVNPQGEVPERSRRDRGCQA